MKKLLLIYTFLISCSAYSQQIPQYTQWYWNQYELNPAYAGIRDCFEMHAQYRLQYLGIDGWPHHGNFTLTMPVKVKRTDFLTPRHGIGLKLATERIGAFLVNRFNLSYAAHINFTQDNRLSVGIDAGVKQLGVDISKISTEEFDPTIHQYVSNWLPDANIGFWWNAKNYYVGLVVKDLVGIKWRNIGLQSKYQLHTFISGGYRFNNQKGFSLVPSALIKLPIQGKMTADVVLLFDHNNQFSYSIGYRANEAVMFGINFKIKEMVAIGYSFDYNFKPLGGGMNSSHELSIAFSGCRTYTKTRTGCDMF
jgi:type IX secretion system PorP/SprF family membrane protein